MTSITSEADASERGELLAINADRPGSDRAAVKERMTLFDIKSMG